MSTRTDWGYFDKCGKPLAVGHEHWKWKCPTPTWVQPEPARDEYTGEWYQPEATTVNCPMESAGFKLERCRKCGIEFRYP